MAWNVHGHRNMHAVQPLAIALALERNSKKKKINTKSAFHNISFLNNIVRYSSACIITDFPRIERIFVRLRVLCVFDVFGELQHERTNEQTKKKQQIVMLMADF